MIIKNLIYILQSENYNLKRFLAFVYLNYKWWSLEQRQKIDWTIKAKTVYSITIIAITIIITALYLKWSFWALALLILLYLLLPLIISAINIVIWPLDKLLKYCLIRKARDILKQNSHLDIIGITGSYGKTSTKEILFSLLSLKYKVLKTPDNINTDIGIARYIINNKQKLGKFDFFIVEMGAYKRGDIKRICQLVSPSYSILTGINEAHLERFGSLDNTIATKFELAQNTKKLSILNFNDSNIAKNYSRFSIKKYKAVKSDLASDIKILANFSGLSFIYDSCQFSTKLLATHNIDLIILALAVTSELGLSTQEAVRAVTSLEYIPHRLEPIFNKTSQVLVIDDSYNGNLAGFKSGLNVLRRAKGRRLVLSPGLVEMGKSNEDSHRQIANLYIKDNIDEVLLIKNSATKFIVAEFKKHNFKNFKIYNSAPEAHLDLKNILKAGDTIIFQNDWPDNYK